MNFFTNSRMVLIGAALLVIIAAFLPWVTLEGMTESVTGLSGRGSNGGTPGAPPDGSATGPGADGFDPSQMMIQRLGLDDTDPAVTAALAVCQPVLDDAMQTTTTEG